MSISIPMIITYVLALIIIYLLGWLLVSPLKWALKSIFWSILGVVSLSLTNLLGSLFGINIAINLFTCLMAGVLGIPGVATLLIIQVIV